MKLNLIRILTNEKCPFSKLNSAMILYVLKTIFYNLLLYLAKT